MNSFVTRAIIFLVLLAAIESFAQTDQNSAKDGKTFEGAQASVVSQCFVSGSGATFLNICLSENGTITRLEAPQSRSHIFGNEGYAVCNQAGFEPFAFEAGLASAGWGVPTVTQPKGIGKFPFIVTRKSTDGNVQLKQTFTLDTAQRQLSVKMDVKNTSTFAFTIPVVTRYFDGDLDGSAGDDIYDVTFDSVDGRNSVVDTAAALGHEIKLSLATLTDPRHQAVTEPFGDWNPLDPSGKQTARSCVSFATSSGTPSDQVGRLEVVLAESQKPGQTKSVTFQYRVF